MSDDKAISVKVLTKKVWSPNLFSFTTTRPDGFRFEAGQFVRLGLNPSTLIANKNKNATNERIFRAYSLVSSPYDEFLEFFSVVVPDGAFTSQLQYLQTDDVLLLNPEPFGYLITSRFLKPNPKELWLLATGTGLAPFLSILRDMDVWNNYEYIVLVYSVRTQSELAYLDTIAKLSDFGLAIADNPAQFIFIPIITREVKEEALHKRIPELLNSGELEKTAGLHLSNEYSHVMICGNPQMVEDTKEVLKTMGLSMNRRGEGNIAVENYW